MTAYSTLKLTLTKIERSEGRKAPHNKMQHRYNYFDENELQKIVKIVPDFNKRVHFNIADIIDLVGYQLHSED